MRHEEIIQELLNTSLNMYYLEIGAYIGTNFNDIEARYKVGVNPVQPDDQLLHSLSDTCKYYALTSDAFFENEYTAGTKFDVIFIDGFHDYDQAYKDIANSLEYLASDGVIVVHDCKPADAVMSLPRSQYDLVDREIKRENGFAWTGDVWKAIVRVRSLRDDLLVFTLDCDYGCAIITRNEPESLLHFSLAEISAMDFYTLNKDYVNLLNLKAPEYLHGFIAKHRRGGKSGELDFYVEDIAPWRDISSRNFHIDKSPGIRIVENGSILPVKAIPGQVSWGGGVCDADGNFVAGHICEIGYPDGRGSCSCAYTVAEDIPHIRETVVYGGLLFNHYGHMIMEFLSRMWWFLENPDCGYKFIFISPHDNIRFIDFFLMLGLRKEDIILLSKPARFDSIIIPDQTTYTFDGYTNKAAAVYDAIRDSVEPACFDKIYLTRANLIPKDIFNEGYFENYYRKLGYEVISPERLPVREQVSLLAGAKEIACVGGTLSNQILFCHDGVSITILNKTVDAISHQQFWMNQLRLAKCTFIDVSTNILPSRTHNSCYLFMPTTHWKNYVADRFKDFSCDVDISINDCLCDYIKSWAELFTQYDEYMTRKLASFTLYDVVINIHKYLIGKEIDVQTKKKLQDAFSISR